MGRLEGNSSDQACVLPFAEGTLTNHNPVAKDEMIMVPETTRMYLFFSVRAYTLDRT